MPWSEGEGKSCSASVHLCSPGLACDPYLKICRRLISVGGSCTEQNAFMCESGICGFAATQTVEGEPLGGRHSLSRYCIVKDLPPGAACDRFRHCVSDCLQCVQGTCKPVFSPLQQQQNLIEQQQELMLPLAVNGFSAEQQQQQQQQQVDSSPHHPHAMETRRLQHMQQISSSNISAAVAPQDPNQPFVSFQQQLQQQQKQQQQNQQQQEGPLDEATVRAAWEQRAAEASALLGEPVTAADLSLFFSLPRDKDGVPLQTRNEQNASNIEQQLHGQQAPWNQLQESSAFPEQQLQLPPTATGGTPGAAASTTAATGSQQRPLLNGSLAKRLARLFTGVSYAFSPETANLQMWGPPMHGFPSALPPQLAQQAQAANPAAALAYPRTAAPTAAAIADPAAAAAAAAGGPQNAYLSTVLPSSMPLQEAEQQVSPQQLQQLQQLLLQQQQGASPFDSSLEAMEAGEATAANPPSKPPPAAPAAPAEGTLTSEEEGEPIQGLVFPGLLGPAIKPFSVLGYPGKRPTGPLPPPLASSPALNMQQPPLPSRLPPTGPPIAGASAAVAPLPPLSTVPLGAIGGAGALGSPAAAAALGGTGALTPLMPPAGLPGVGGPLLGPLPGRFPTDYKGGCWIDRCCASVSYLNRNSLFNTYLKP